MTKGKTEHLTHAEKDGLRRDLEAKRAELLKRVEERADDPSDSAELEDVAEGVIEDRNRETRTDRDQSLLADVDRALAKFAAGTYGTSEGSGRPIPFARLKAVPWARYDVEDEEHHEEAGRH
jgi:DnaK suppressor protein